MTIVEAGVVDAALAVVEFGARSDGAHMRDSARVGSQ